MQTTKKRSTTTNRNDIVWNMIGQRQIETNICTFHILSWTKLDAHPLKLIDMVTKMGEKIIVLMVILFIWIVRKYIYPVYTTVICVGLILCHFISKFTPISPYVTCYIYTTISVHSLIFSPVWHNWSEKN